MLSMEEDILRRPKIGVCTTLFITDLPNEIIAEILLEAGKSDPKDLGRLAQVNRLFRSIINDVPQLRKIRIHHFFRKHNVSPGRVRYLLHTYNMPSRVDRPPVNSQSPITVPALLDLLAGKTYSINTSSIKIRRRTIRCLERLDRGSLSAASRFLKKYKSHRGACDPIYTKILEMILDNRFPKY